MKYLEEWLKAAGIAVSDFETVIHGAMEKFDVPSEVIDAVSTWVQENAKAPLTSERILAFAAFAFAELKSGAPGYNPDAGGLA